MCVSEVCEGEADRQKRKKAASIVILAKVLGLKEMKMKPKQKVEHN